MSGDVVRNFLTIEAANDQTVVQVLDAVRYEPTQAEKGGAQFEIAEFSSDLSLERILPTPRDSEEFSADLLGWREQRWGTKWDVLAKVTSRADGLALIEFTSHDNPPIQAIEHLSSRFPSVALRLDYRGAKKSGVVEYNTDDGQMELVQVVDEWVIYKLGDDYLVFHEAAQNSEYVSQDFNEAKAWAEDAMNRLEQQ